MDLFRLPETVIGAERIGENASAFPQPAVAPFRSPVIVPAEDGSNGTSDTTNSGVVDETLPAVAVTQDPPLSLPDPINDVIDDTLNGSLPVLPDI